MTGQANSKSELKEYSSKSFGSTYLLSSIARSTGAADLLNRIFPGLASDLLPIAYFYALNTLPLTRLRWWAADHYTPSPPERFSPEGLMDVFRQIHYSDVLRFLDEWRKLHAEDSYICYDTTGFSEKSSAKLSSLSGDLRASSAINVVDLCLVFGQKSFLPAGMLHYHGRPGNAADIVGFFQKHGFFRPEQMSYVLDDNYYSEDNLNIILNSPDEFHYLLRVKQKAKGIFDSLKEKFTKDQELELSAKKDKFILTEKIKMGEKKVYVHIFKNRFDRIAASNAAVYNLRDMLFLAA